MVLSRESERGASALLPPLPTARAGGQDTKGEGQENQLMWKTRSGQAKISAGLAVQVLQKKWYLIMLVLLSAHLWHCLSFIQCHFFWCLTCTTSCFVYDCTGHPIAIPLPLHLLAEQSNACISAQNIFLMLAGESSRVTNDSQTIQTLS